MPMFRFVTGLSKGRLCVCPVEVISPCVIRSSNLSISLISKFSAFMIVACVRWGICRIHLSMTCRKHGVLARTSSVPFNFHNTYILSQARGISEQYLNLLSVWQASRKPPSQPAMLRRSHRLGVSICDCSFSVKARLCWAGRKRQQLLLLLKKSPVCAASKRVRHLW